MNVIKHIVSELNENQEQHCIMCGEKICDLKNAAFTGVPHKGFPAGEIYVWGDNPRNISTTAPKFVTINHCSKNMSSTDFPRRNRLDLNTLAEKAIYEVMQQVEEIGADPKLTDVVTMLAKAKDLLSDYIDENLDK